MDMIKPLTGSRTEPRTMSVPLRIDIVSDVV